MKPSIRLPVAVAAVLISLWAAYIPPAAAGYDEGAAAFIRGDYETAWREWLALGKRGHQSAQYNLGVLYSIGLGVEQNDEEASTWFRRAADRGLPAAQMRLGTAYLDGKGVPEDPEEAYFWFTLAATHFSLGEQHEQAVAARENAGARLTRGQITEVLERAMSWKPLPQTIDESEKERLIAAPTGGKNLVLDGQNNGSGTQTADTGGAQAATLDVESAGPVSEASSAGDRGAEPDATQAQKAALGEAPEADVPRSGTNEMDGQATANTPGVQAENGAPAAQEKPAPATGQTSEAEMPSQNGPVEVATATEEGGSETTGAGETSAPSPRRFFAAHLSSVRNRDGTEEEWQSLVRRFPDLLGDRTLTVRSIEIPDKGTFYRVMAGSFDSFDAAQELCDKITVSDQYCVVRRVREQTTQ